MLKVQSIDMLEFRGMNDVKKDDQVFSFFRFEDADANSYEFIGFDVSGRDLLRKGEIYTCMFKVGKSGKVSLCGVQHE